MKKVIPTKLQKRTLELIRENPEEWEKHRGKIMVKAGYSPKTASHPKQNFVARRGTIIALEEWREMLRGTGLTEEYLIRKYKEWLEAKKSDNQTPDYEIQLKVKDDLRGDLGLPLPNKPSILQRFDVGGEMTLEFIGPNGEKIT